MIRSRSSVLRSMPVYQAQLNRTDFRSFAPAAGVYSGSPPPRRRFCAPVGFAVLIRAPTAGAEACSSCALHSNGALMMRAATIAAGVDITFFREAMVISGRGRDSLVAAGVT